jgi:hypothetical protein
VLLLPLLSRIFWTVASTSFSGVGISNCSHLNQKLNQFRFFIQCKVCTSWPSYWLFSSHVIWQCETWYSIHYSRWSQRLPSFNRFYCIHQVVWTPLLVCWISKWTIVGGMKSCLRSLACYDSLFQRCMVIHLHIKVPIITTCKLFVRSLEGQT